MAESFCCGSEWVHFSNGATESLFECWEKLALASLDTPGMSRLAAYLRRTIDHEGAGCRAFGLIREYMPDELTGPAELAALLAVVESTINDPTQIPDVNWSPEMIELWREKLKRIAHAVRKLSPA